MDEINLPYRGWREGVVPVDRAPSKVAAVMEVQGYLMSSYYVYGLVDTPDRLEQGTMLCTQNHSRQRLRAVVPREYTHLKIRNTRSGITRWAIGFRPADTCQELHKTVHGSHPDVLHYRGRKTTATFEVFDTGYADLSCFAMDGSGGDSLHYVSLGPFRGRVKLPAGPILVQVDCLVDWSLTIKD